MTRDDIIRLWHEAGGKYSSDPQLYDILMIRDTDLERFFNLVAAAEREACAQECEGIGDGINKWSDAYGCASAIRARSKE